MSKEYLTYVRKYADLTEGERDIFIKDLTPGPRKYDTKQVRAIITRSAENLSEADTLWVRSEMGVLAPEPWAIKIIKELPDYVVGPPYTDVFSVMNK
ncbi:MAG: hypothetical protein PHO01_06675 [Desulfotomaculaceae bacterium]|nr:hypothetical protein [Desulfotomaculaceae bacterium]